MLPILLLADASSRLDPIETVGKAQSLIERQPLAFVAAFFACAFAVSLYLVIRAKDRHLLKQEQAATAHAEAMAETQRDYADKIDRLREAEHERAIKLEILLHGILEVTDDIRYLAFQARQREARRPRTGESKAVGAPGTGEHKLP
jgi:hypothetical protein